MVSNPGQKGAGMKCIHCGQTEHASLDWLSPENRRFEIGEACCDEFWNELYEDYDFAVHYFKDVIESWTREKIRGYTFFGDLNMKLQVKPIKQSDAKDFIQQHHRHNKPPVGWRFGAGIWNWETLIGVVMVGRPVARKLDHHSTVEVNRLCIDTNIDPELSAHACSQLYGWSAREAKKRGFEKIITYTLQTESGVSLKAAGWLNEGSAGGGSWNVKSRPRIDSAPIAKKIRWSRQLRKPQPAALAA